MQSLEETLDGETTTLEVEPRDTTETVRARGKEGSLPTGRGSSCRKQLEVAPLFLSSTRRVHPAPVCPV